MEESRPALRKPPGYRDPNTPMQRRMPPPRRANLPPSFNPHKRLGCSCCRCCCCVFLFFFVLLLLAAIAGGVFYLWFQPKLPVFHLKSLRLTRFNVTDTPDGPKLAAETDVAVEVANPNGQLSVAYGRTSVALREGGDGVGLGSASLDGFTQGRRNVTELRFTARIRDVLIDEGTSRRLRDGFLRKSLAVSAEVKTGVGIGGSGWSTGKIAVKVVCGALRLNQAEGGATPKCHFNVLNWINI